MCNALYNILNRFALYKFPESPEEVTNDIVGANDTGFNLLTGETTNVKMAAVPYSSAPMVNDVLEKVEESVYQFLMRDFVSWSGALGGIYNTG